MEGVGCCLWAAAEKAGAAKRAEEEAAAMADNAVCGMWCGRFGVDN